MHCSSSVRLFVVLIMPTVDSEIKAEEAMPSPSRPAYCPT